MKKALITGINGQDGSYLGEFLIEKGYEVHGIIRAISLEDRVHKLSKISRILDKVILHIGSIESFISVSKIIREVEPEELYHLAAHSYVGDDFGNEFSTLETNVSGTYNILASIREYLPKTKLYFAGSSEMFGACNEYPQTEKTVFMPRSIYGISKVTGYHLVNNYRNRYGINAAVGILYNHESPRRGFEYVTRKITFTAARIKKGKEKEIVLGNIDAKRDWGYAKDYVKAMWLMLERGINGDYVVSTGKLHSVKDILKIAFDYIGLDYKRYVRIDPKFFRPNERIPLVGNSTRARKELDWRPTKLFKEVIEEMVEADLENC